MITINGKQYKELRCYACQGFIIYQSIRAGIIFYQCPKCGYANEFTFKYLKTDKNTSTMEKEYSVESSHFSKGGEKKQ